MYVTEKHVVPTVRVSMHSGWGFPGGSDGKELACSAGDPGSIPGSGRSPGGGNSEKLLLNHTKTVGFLAPGGEEFNPGPETRLDRSEILCNKVLLNYKGDRESF